jgi:membrane-anchored glycerophosphoryl diester phosphodiesterase (GDPDase)
MNLFLPLLGFGFVVFVATAVGFILLVIPGVLIMFGISFTCIYMLPLMTDQKLGLVDAVKTSYDMSMKGSLADHFVMIIIFFGIIMIGNAVFIGSLFTQPLATVFLLLVYEEKIKERVPDKV